MEYSPGWSSGAIPDFYFAEVKKLSLESLQFYLEEAIALAAENAPHAPVIYSHLVINLAEIEADFERLLSYLDTLNMLVEEP